MELRELEKKHRAGILLLKERGYYGRLVSEIPILMKYLDDQLFIRLFSQNLFDDMRGVFGTFVRQDLPQVYEEMNSVPGAVVITFLKREYANLEILHKCSVNLHYQRKSIIRMPGVQKLEFKSSLITDISKKFNGEIQEIYRVLEINYKHYFRLQFSENHLKGKKVSLSCIDKLKRQYGRYFLGTFNRLYQLADALEFVRMLLNYNIETEIGNRLGELFFDKREKLGKITRYFIDDLKYNFIRTLDRQQRSGRSFNWIRHGFEQFIDSPRFETLMHRVIYQTLILVKRGQQSYRSADIF